MVVTFGMAEEQASLNFKNTWLNFDNFKLDAFHRSAGHEPVTPLDWAVGIHEVGLHKHVVDVASDAWR